MKERIQKILSQRGVASRRQAEQMILDGRVSCNGAVCVLGDTADADTDILLLDEPTKAIDPAAKKELAKFCALGFDHMPVCMAKTQYSFSDDATKLGAPEGFTVTVRNVKVSAGAGFIVALTGDIMTMPGLPKSPAAERIDVDENGKISGLF